MTTVACSLQTNTDPSSSWTTCMVSSSSSSRDCMDANKQKRKSGRKPRARGIKQARVCGVCGDKARSLHFGGLSCDSCKAFFRRAVQSLAYKNFHCPQVGNKDPNDNDGPPQYCVVDISSRKTCQKCRFERCVEIGMEISWVMSEAERQRLLSVRLEKRRSKRDTGLPITSTTPLILNKPLEDYLWPLHPEIVNLESVFKIEETEAINGIRKAWIDALQNLPPTPLEGVNLQQEIDHVVLVRSMTGSVQRFQLFATPLLQSATMLEEDKKVLLSGSMLELCIFRGALNHSRAATLYQRFFPQHLHEIHCRFVKSIQELHLDQTTVLIFLMVILMNPERPQLKQASDIDKIQEYYLLLLNKYLLGRYGDVKASSLYPKLLNKLTDLRELSDCHQEQHLLFDHNQLQSMKSELSRIKYTSDGTFEPPQKFILTNVFAEPSSSSNISPASPTFSIKSEPVNSGVEHYNNNIMSDGYATSTSTNSDITPSPSAESNVSSSQFNFMPTSPFNDGPVDDLYSQISLQDNKTDNTYSYPLSQYTPPQDVSLIEMDYPTTIEAFTVQEKQNAENFYYGNRNDSIYTNFDTSYLIEDQPYFPQYCVQDNNNSAFLSFPTSSNVGFTESFNFNSTSSLDFFNDNYLYPR